MISHATIILIIQLRRRLEIGILNSERAGQEVLRGRMTM